MPNEYLSRIKPYLANIKALDPIKTGVLSKFQPDSAIKSIVFDIYGTLIISASGDLDKSNVTHDGINKAITESGLAWVNNNFAAEADNLLKEFHETVLRHQNELKEKGHPYPEVDIIKVWQQVTDKAIELKWVKRTQSVDLKLLTVVFEVLSNAVWPMPKMNETLQKLFASKLPIGIVSNAQFYTPILMNYFIHDKVTDKEFIDGFNDDISVYSYKLLRSKPDTFLFEILAKSLKNNYNLEPHEVLFVGNDMLKDIWTAKQLGFKTALFAGDERSLRMRKTDERTANLEADYIITELEQLFEIVSLA